MKNKLLSVVYACLSVFIAGMIIFFPQEVLQASKRGLEMWANVVFPSLLPFFIIAEILIAFGVVHFIGVLFEPIMRPLFNVPGIGGFVWAMGMASGYPSGAKFTARLRQEGHLSQIEAERLVSFTNASNPLFIIGAVAIGFFHDHQLGILLAVTHYASNFCVGLCMRFHQYKQKEKYSFQPFSITKAFHKLHKARLEGNRTLGKILGDAITRSIQTLIAIGGFIILFSVLTEIMHEINFAQLVSGLISIILAWFQLPAEMALPFFSGLFELTIGANEISKTSSETLIQVIFVSVILAFNGFSVQAQVASILAETDIRFLPYFIARLIHCLFAVIIVSLLYVPLYVQPTDKTGADIPVSASLSFSDLGHFYLTLEQTGYLITFFALCLYLFLLARKKG